MVHSLGCAHQEAVKLGVSKIDTPSGTQEMTIINESRSQRLSVDFAGPKKVWPLHSSQVFPPALSA